MVTCAYCVMLAEVCVCVRLKDNGYWWTEAKIDVKDAVMALESAKLAHLNEMSNTVQSANRGQSSRVGVTALDVLQVGEVLISGR